jgi:hypothetical protein
LFAANPADDKASVHGQILGAAAWTGGRIQVELQLAGASVPAARAPVGAAGEFEFDSVPAGAYRLLLTAERDSLIQDQSVHFGRGPNFVLIRLPETNRRGYRSQTVSLRELGSKVPRAARIEWVRARQAMRDRDPLRAIGHLMQAINLHPSFAEAYNDLGVCQASLNYLSEAIEDFQIARRLDPSMAAASANLGSLLLRQRRYPEAEQAALQALRLDPDRGLARLVLGLSLKEQDRDEREVIDALDRAAEDYSEARLAAAGYLERRGRQGRAAGELKQYLQSAPAVPYSAAVESWLARLQH